MHLESGHFVRLTWNAGGLQKKEGWGRNGNSFRLQGFFFNGLPGQVLSITKKLFIIFEINCVDVYPRTIE